MRALRYLIFVFMLSMVLHSSDRDMALAKTGGKRNKDKKKNDSKKGYTARIVPGYTIVSTSDGKSIEAKNCPIPNCIIETRCGTEKQCKKFIEKEGHLGR